MGYRLRYQSKSWATHHVVSRCVQGCHLLKPTPEILSKMTGVLGRALHVYGSHIQLHAYVFLSNHFHLLISSETSGALSEFMKYLKGNLTRELNHVHNRSGAMWQSRYSSEEILDQESYDGLFKYLTENSVKEGLVDHPREWAGLHSYHQLVEGKSISGLWLDRTALREAQRSPHSRGRVTQEHFTKIYQVKLSRSPFWMHLSEQEHYERCIELTRVAVEQAKLKRGEKVSIGMDNVLAARVDEPRPIKKRGRRSLCHAHFFEVRFVYRLIYQSFKAKYQEMYRALRDGLLDDHSCLSSYFPEGGVPPLGICSLIQRE